MFNLHVHELLDCFYTNCVYCVQPSRTRPPPESEQQPAPTNEQGDPPSPMLSVEDEGLGSETKLDRPPSAKGSRRRTTAGNSDSDIGTGDSMCTYTIVHICFWDQIL